MAPVSTVAPGLSVGEPGRREFGYSPFVPLLLLVVGAYAFRALGEWYAELPPY